MAVILSARMKSSQSAQSVQSVQLKALVVLVQYSPSTKLSHVTHINRHPSFPRIRYRHPSRDNTAILFQKRLFIYQTDTGILSKYISLLKYSFLSKK